MTTVAQLLTRQYGVGVWDLDPARSRFAFSNKTMWGLTTVNGHFADVSGDGQITNAGGVFGRLDIVAASLHTGVGQRDEHLRSADFFDVERYPEISVIVTGVDAAHGDGADLTADIVIKGVSYPLPLRATVVVVDDHALRVSTHTSVDREQLGVTGNLVGMVGPVTKLSADAVFVRAD
jgi:polyisoprenoid-binding protein YceI